MNHTARRVLLPPVLICLLVTLSGCPAMLGWVANVFAPPKKIDAIYQLPKDKKVLVFVDDLLKPVSYEPIKGELTDRLNTQLVDHEVAAKTVSYQELLALMAATPDFNRLHIGEIGKKLGADLVLHLEIEQFSLKDYDETPLWHGRMTANVRIVDAEGVRLWPTDRTGGVPIVAETPEGPHPTEDYSAELSKILADKMADNIAKLFYKHEVTDLEAAKAEK